MVKRARLMLLEGAVRVRIATAGRLFIVAEDQESQRALYLLIKECTGISRSEAEGLLKDGKLLFGRDFIACPQDVFESVHSAIGSTEPQRERPAND